MWLSLAIMQSLNLLVNIERGLKEPMFTGGIPSSSWLKTLVYMDELICNKYIQSQIHEIKL